MENEIKKLIKKWSKNYRIIQSYENACEEIEEDLKDLLKFKQEMGIGK